MILVALTIMVFGANAAAQELMTQAKNIIRPRQGLLCRFMSGPDYDEAENLFKQAANQFKIGRQWQDAAEAFEQCAHCAQQTGSHQEAQYLVEAGKVMKRVTLPFKNKIFCYGNQEMFNPYENSKIFLELNGGTQIYSLMVKSSL